MSYHNITEHFDTFLLNNILKKLYLFKYWWSMNIALLCLKPLHVLKLHRIYTAPPGFEKNVATQVLECVVRGVWQKQCQVAPVYWGDCTYRGHTPSWKPYTLNVKYPSKMIILVCYQCKAFIVILPFKKFPTLNCSNKMHKYFTLCYLFPFETKMFGELNLADNLS